MVDIFNNIPELKLIICYIDYQLPAKIFKNVILDHSINRNNVGKLRSHITIHS